MRVYYLTSEEHALNNIKNRRLKISLLEDLNDPFELMGVELKTSEHRKLFKDYKEYMSAHSGVICFSRTWHNPLMWSHYGDKHKGICLGFDIDDEHLKKVIYRRKRKSIDLDNELYRYGVTAKHIDDLLIYKFIDWEYEKEVRSFVPLNTKDDVTGLYFTLFENNLKLKEVILGSRNNLNLNQILSAVDGLNEDVSIFKTRMAFNSFQVVTDKSKEKLLYTYESKR